MADLSIYRKFYDIKTTTDLVNKFQETLTVSNKTFSYFVDWPKVKENIQKYDYEINILNYLIGSTNVQTKLKEILGKNPEVLPVIPLIIAVRDSEINVIEDPVKPTETMKQFNFDRKDKLSEKEIEKIASFCEKSGILKLFSDFKIKNLRDFLLGVETGLDTNARKNRSGTAMEFLINPILDKIKGVKIIKQKAFKYLEEKEKIKIPQKLANRKFDYVIINKDKYFNMEVNYYDGQGSKPQEIVDSYINRRNELVKESWGFIWLTDGVGWRGGTNQITNAFNDMEYVLNIEFARKGILEGIIS
jgi:type II restriction enzyme